MPITLERNRINKLAEENYKKFLPVVEKWMDFTIKEINRAFRKKYITKSCEFQKDKAIDITTKLLDWEKLNEDGKRMLKPAMLNIMAKSGNEAYKIVGFEASFDILNPKAVKAVDKICSKLVTQVNKETKQAINHVIREGIKEGKSMGRVAKELRPLVGLTERQAKAVRNYEQWLINKRPDISALKRAKWVERYNKKLHKYRTELIARTESMRATNEGNLIGYKEAGYKTVRWSANVDACPLCDAENGHVYTIEESRGMLPAHPDCRCSWLPESKVEVPKGPRGDRLGKLELSDLSKEELKKEIKLYNKLFDRTNRLETKYETRNRIINELYKKLKNNKAFEKYFKSQTLYSKKEIIEDWMLTWAVTSGDSEVSAIAIQMAAKREFGLVKSVSNHFSKAKLKEALKILNSSQGEAMQAFLRAQYDLTQEFFKKKGITHLTGYRGLTFTKKVPGFAFSDEKVLIAQSKLKLQPLSSFSTRFETAQDFAIYKAENDYQIILQSKVPVSRILSTCQTGVGCKEEAEFIVLGGQDIFKTAAYTNQTVGRYTTFDYFGAFADLKSTPK